MPGHPCGNGATLRLDGYGLQVGSQADLVLIDAETVAEAVAARPPRRMVVKRGRVVARDGVSLVAAA